MGFELLVEHKIEDKALPDMAETLHEPLAPKLEYESRSFGGWCKKRITRATDPFDTTFVVD